MLNEKKQNTIQFTIPLKISISLEDGVPVVSADMNKERLEAFEAIDESQLEVAVSIDQHYGNRKGFDENFIEGVGLPKLSAEQENLAAKVLNSDNFILKYYHFSIVINKQRKMPLFTAVNIDGAKYNSIKNQIPSRKAIGTDKWYIDTRIEPDPKNPQFQIPAKFYAGNIFDIGHQVRRADPVWGDTADFAIKCNNDTFHLTNACPQHKNFNQGINDKTDPNYKNVIGKILWQGLENYILDNARKNELNVNVYTGPILAEDDKEYQNTGVKIPKAFWKIVVMAKENGELSATAYFVSQEDLIDDVFETFTYGKFLFYQVPVSHIEKLTGLTFNLSKYDPLTKRDNLNEDKSFEAFQEVLKPLQSLEEIIF